MRNNMAQAEKEFLQNVVLKQEEQKEGLLAELTEKLKLLEDRLREEIAAREFAENAVNREIEARVRERVGVLNERLREDFASEKTALRAAFERELGRRGTGTAGGGGSGAAGVMVGGVVPGRGGSAGVLGPGGGGTTPSLSAGARANYSGTTSFGSAKSLGQNDTMFRSHEVEQNDLHTMVSATSGVLPPSEHPTNVGAGTTTSRAHSVGRIVSLRSTPSGRTGAGAAADKNMNSPYSSYSPGGVGGSSVNKRSGGTSQTSFLPSAAAMFASRMGSSGAPRPTPSTTDTGVREPGGLARSPFSGLGSPLSPRLEKEMRMLSAMSSAASPADEEVLHQAPSFRNPYEDLYKNPSLRVVEDDDDF